VPDLIFGRLWYRAGNSKGAESAAGKRPPPTDGGPDERHGEPAQQGRGRYRRLFHAKGQPQALGPNPARESEIRRHLRNRVREPAEDQDAEQAIPGAGKERDTKKCYCASQGSRLHTASGADTLDYPAKGRRGKRLRGEEERNRYAERRCTETKVGSDLYREPAGQKNRENPARGDRDSPQNGLPPRPVASIASYIQISGDVDCYAIRPNLVFTPRR
jgi:hypothetical protein